MAKVEQTKQVKVRNLFAFVEDEIHKANNDLKDEEQPNTVRDKPGFTSSRDASAKTHLTNVIKAVGWLKINLQITGNIAPFTNAEIDALNREIRKFDDGND